MATTARTDWVNSDTMNDIAILDFTSKETLFTMILSFETTIGTGFATNSLKLLLAKRDCTAIVEHVTSTEPDAAPNKK